MKAFFAYPDGVRTVTDAVTGCAELAPAHDIVLTPWEFLSVFGFKVDDLIREKIFDTDVLFADITFPNHNVFYEIGYAIASSIPVIPTVNQAISQSIPRIQRLGLFDTIGWLTYSNSLDLMEKVISCDPPSWANDYVRKRDHIQPLFVLDTQIRTDFRNHIFHAIANSQVNFRSFDPTEVSRLTAAQVISEVSSSAGVIVQLLGGDIVDSCRNNLRASFILGLCHGYDINALALQYEDIPAPLDFRDYISNSTYRGETQRHTENFCTRTLVWNQQALARERSRGVGILSDIDLGSPTAENETQQLKDYFVETAEFLRALRAEGAVVIGRKGAGKTAVHIQVSETILRDRRACVVDLRPASHNLTEMREALLSVLSAGVFDHTVAAFWQYILYVEILLKVREIALPRSRNDFNVQERIREAEKRFSLNENIVSGDFTSRLDAAVREVVRIVKTTKDVDHIRSQLTNIMFEKPIRDLRETIKEFSDLYDYVVVLVDDLDKGWPPHGVESHDIAIVKHLIEVLHKMQRDLNRQSVEFRHLLFLRSDIYEKLVEETSDRGKYNVISVDWSDPEQLRHLLRQRVENHVDRTRREEAWEAFNQRLEADSDVVGRLIEGSLRRPRFLIDVSERILSVAINRGHRLVTSEDVEEGMRQMSLYLVSDFGYEMRDISGSPEDVFYMFIGYSGTINRSEIVKIFTNKNLGITGNDAIELLLWYGFLGIYRSSGEAVYIYDRAYDFRRLMAEIPFGVRDLTYAINPAFLRGLRTS